MYINTQQISKCKLCDDRDESINHIISVSSKLAQKEYKARHDWIGKVIYLELCKKLKLGYTTESHIHNPKSVLEKETQKILRYEQITESRPEDQT